MENKNAVDKIIIYGSLVLVTGILTFCAKEQFTLTIFATSFGFSIRALWSNIRAAIQAKKESGIV